MGFLVKLRLIGECPEPLAVEDSFNLREAGLDAVELRRVTYVENLCNVELTVQMLHLLLVGVHTELVHQYSEGLAAVFLSQRLQVACEVISRYSSAVYVEPLKPFFSRNSDDD